MRTRKGIIGLGFVCAWLAWALPAQAACTPASGPADTYTCAAGSSFSQVQQVLNDANDGAVITFLNGNYTWSGDLFLMQLRPPHRGVTLICQTVGGCNMTMNAAFIAETQISGDHNKLVRVSGFDFIRGTSNQFLQLEAQGGASQHYIRKLRLDHNTFTNYSGGPTMSFSGGSRVYIYGVFDHNTWTASNNYGIVEYYGLSLVNNGPTGIRGTEQNLYWEDNVINFGTQSVDTISCSDSTGEGAMVFRFNTFTNCRLAFHGSTSSGSRNIEIYGNVLNMTSSTCGGCSADGFRMIGHQGSGENIYWGNRVDALLTLSASAIAIGHYRSVDPTTGGYNYSGNPGHCDGTNVTVPDGNRSPTATNHGYPCWHQPGRDNAGILQPMYFWQNVNADTGARIDTDVDEWHAPSPTNYWPDHVKENRDWFDAVSANPNSSCPTPSTCTPFNGTVGVGFGPLAFRPGTCSPGNAQVQDAGRSGVGYFCTDCGTWKNATPSQGVDVDEGILYRCATTNTWVPHYTPLQYPHPLVSGSVDETPPATPTGLQVN